MTHAFLVLALLLQSEIPERPEDLKYKGLTFDVPDPGKMRAALSNGVVLMAMEDRSLPKIELTVYVRGGSFWDDAGKEGTAGFCGTLMRIGGTANRAPQALDDEIDFLAAELGVSLGGTQGSASLSVLSKDLDKGLEILFDVLRNPSFSQEKIDLLKAQTLEQLKARNDRTGGIEGREANLLLYGDYPLNRHPTGASVGAITREDLIAFHARTFHPANIVVAAAGDFDRAQLAQKLEAAMKGWQSKERTPAAPKVTHAAKPGVYCFHKEGRNINQGRVTIAHLGIDLHHPDNFALRVMSYIYGGGGFSSRLTQKVRTEMGLAYDVGSDFRPGIAHVGAMRIAFQSKSETVALAAKTCLEELDRIRTQTVTEEELAAAKQFYLDAFPGLFFSTAQQTVNTFANAELNTYPENYFQNYRKKIASVTRDDVRRVAVEQLLPDKFVIVVVGNIGVIKEGEARAKLGDLGRTIIDVPLPDPVTLERPKQ